MQKVDLHFGKNCKHISANRSQRHCFSRSALTPSMMQLFSTVRHYRASGREAPSTQNTRETKAWVAPSRAEQCSARVCQQTKPTDNKPTAYHTQVKHLTCKRSMRLTVCRCQSMLLRMARMRRCSAGGLPTSSIWRRRPSSAIALLYCSSVMPSAEGSMP